MPLSPAEQDVLFSLSQPVPPDRRQEFLDNVASELAARQAPTGPGALHWVAAVVQKQFTAEFRAEAEAHGTPAYSRTPTRWRRSGSSED
jgi:hypothetical protein